MHDLEFWWKQFEMFFETEANYKQEGRRSYSQTIHLMKNT